MTNPPSPEPAEFRAPGPLRLDVAIASLATGAAAMLACNFGGMAYTDQPRPPAAP